MPTRSTLRTQITSILMTTGQVDRPRAWCEEEGRPSAAGRQQTLKAPTNGRRDTASSSKTTRAGREIAQEAEEAEVVQHLAEAEGAAEAGVAREQARATKAGEKTDRTQQRQPTAVDKEEADEAGDQAAEATTRTRGTPQTTRIRTKSSSGAGKRNALNLRAQARSSTWTSSRRTPGRMAADKRGKRRRELLGRRQEAASTK